LPASSKVEANAVTNVPQLTLTFTADKGDNSVAYEFLYQRRRDQSRCGVNFNYGVDSNARGTSYSNEAQRSGGNNGVWTMLSNTGGCADGVTYRYQVADFNNALKNCGWDRTESTTVTTFTTTVLATSLQQGSRIRNVLVTRQLETSVTIGINYLTNISATAGPLRVFGPVINEATLQAQVFNPLSYTASWGLLTSVQGPYQLTLLGKGKPTSSATGWNAAFTWNAMSAENAGFLGLPADAAITGTDSSAADGVSGADHLAKCAIQAANGALSGNTNYSNPTGTYTACVQRWFLSATKACTADATDMNLNSDWNATFGVTCHSTFTGSCRSTPQTTEVTVSWSTYSDNYCPRIIDTEASTATLKVYQKDDWSEEQTQFVFGTASYFEATATSSIKIEDLQTERILITEGGVVLGAPAPNQLVYEKTGFNPANWFSGDDDTALSSSTTKADFLQNFHKNVSVGAGTGDPLKRKTRWSWVWSSANSAATGDFPTDATVQVDLRIKYTDQGAATKRGLDALSVRFVPHLSATTAGATAQANVGVTARATSTGAAPTSGASSSSAMSAQTIAIGAAVVGGVALVAAGVAVARRRTVVAKSTATNMESVEMRGLPTATNVV